MINKLSKAWFVPASVCVALIASSNAMAATISASYGWEDGAGTILGSFGNLSSAANVATGDEFIDSVLATPGVTPNGGSRMLELEESPHSGTPQGYLAYIENLEVGDTVTASFFGWDSTELESPSLRIWGHWAENGDVLSFVGSAGGNSTFTGDGPADWYEVGHTWTAEAGDEALVIEARLYSSPSTADPAFTTYFVDDLSVEVNTASGRATITTAAVPEPSGLLALSATGMAVIGVRRRKRA